MTILAAPKSFEISLLLRWYESEYRGKYQWYFWEVSSL